MYSPDKNITQDSSKTLIVKNQCYELLYHPQKNRVYLNIYGFWKGRNHVPDYLSDLKKALALVQLNFTLLLDLRTMITHPQDVMRLHIEGLEVLQAGGLRKSACVDPSDRIANLQVEDTLVKSHLSSKRFTSYSEAEAWLEE
ncbi:hypothetical protein [Pontibacter litorisediminis]|uniref:hypothetical protein n=1 Tax=Pontibacter litorisediminis TaxID=1846260 RepID=UPI0023EAF557|nr:hypothetical protein [Pontibacter litorisediminis]